MADKKTGNRSVRFAVVGCGNIGKRHIEHINKVGELVAVCDNKEEKLQPWTVNKYTDIKDLLANEKNIDVISICSPNFLHASHTIAALKAGFHVLCEKPMATSVYDCGEMIKEAERANRRLFIVKQNRFNPPVEAVKKLIDEGKLGKIYSIQLSCFWNRNNDYYTTSDWKGKKNLDGGTLYTQFSHFIDLLYWLIGDVRRVHAFTANYAHQGIVEFEDAGVVALEFYNGVIGTINYTVNAYKKNMEGSLTIFAEKGTVKIGGQYLNELEYQQIENFEIQHLPKGNTANNYGTYQGSMSNHDKVYENVVEVLTKQGIIATNGFEGLKTVEIIDKIYQAVSAKN
ncbi:Gfo/Idh/MocA family protein [Thermoflexibacter ruber]|uniref:Predicted dehydrogenase n=1 Tax=Thermoflexibacter ruber TaxID=1003 RepID=A0A1I2IUS7_9BACT|nr:Gfo/Idh/MocA family oxidoreductase [Thermoflexibacter ruber]SFF46125.1 Predicted dehydrogenase [Thermoflexibacter ruber]